MTDDYCMDSIHPPNVVLVDSNQSSPDHNPQAHCSPLSTAPNSPYRVSYEEEDDDDDDDDEGIEIRPEEILELLDTPASNRRIPGITLNEVPFDEGEGHKETPPKVTSIDPLLGNLRSFQNTNTKPVVVSPIPPHEDIDAYEEEEDDENRSDEKKEESPLPPVYTGFLVSNSSKPNNSLFPQRVVPPALSEDDSVPMDEKQPSPAKTNTSYVEYDESLTKEALQSASKEVQEMEQRIQRLIRRRNSNKSGSNAEGRSAVEQEAKVDPYELDPGVSSPSFDDNLDGEPPSLSPPRDVHSSMESSSYYYDGSIINSSTVTDDVNNTTLESSVSLTLGGNTKEAVSIHPPVEPIEDNFYSRLKATSREESSSSDRLRSSSSRMDFTPSSSFEVFASQFDTSQTANSSFADIVSGTASRALNQVSDDLANFLAMPQGDSSSLSNMRRQSSQKRSKKCRPPASQDCPQISPSDDSDGTSHTDNLSPRRTVNATSKLESHASDEDLLYRQKPSAKLAKARSLISGRQSKSPTTAPYLQSSSRDDPKQRARQVMNKREREKPSSKPWRSSSDKQNPSETLNIPVPPTLYRIAAMMEGLGGGEDGIGMVGPDMDWPNSVGQFMEEYQTAITESLRNLSIDEISGLAQDSNPRRKLAPEFGKDMVSPGIPLSASADTADPFINSFRNLNDGEYDNLVAEMTFGSCLQMPQLDHPSPMPTRNSSIAKRPTDTKDRKKGNSLGKKYFTGLAYQRVNDEQEPQRPDDDDDDDDDDEHQERAVFAKTLSERLMNLAPNSSHDDSVSVDEQPDAADKQGNMKAEDEGSLDCKESSFAMSPPGRGFGDANQDSMAGPRYQRGGLFASNMPTNGDLPHSEQPSVSSDAMHATPGREGPKAQVKLSGTPGTNKSGGSFAENKPTMVKIIDNETGIAKGDVMLSLLCDNSFQASKENPDSWAWRVREAIWRGREMRREKASPSLSRGISHDEADRPSTYSRSLPVDVDDVRVIGGIQNVSSIEEKAVSHLERDEFEQALELYEDIIFNYYRFFEEVLAKRNELSSEDITTELSNFKPYIGASLHNLGVIHLLKGDYEDGFSFFKRAVDNRRACLGDDHPDCVTSLVRLATCRFAMDNFADAHTNLELALALAGSKARTTNDYCQLGEILNNLGCLSYMCGQPTKAMKLFRESLDVQLAVLNSTLYGGAKYAAHSATLNISITRGNIGFLALVLRDVSSGIVALEAALREQRLLLTGAHVTLVSTMDHLAVANLLDGRTHKAVKMLKRIFELQKAAYGPNDKRCFATLQKIMTIRGQQMEDPRPSPGTRPQRPFAAEESKSLRPDPEKPLQIHTRTSSEEGTSSSRCTPVSSGHAMIGSGGSGKVNSVFKAIRSLGRKKS